MNASESPFIKRPLSDAEVQQRRKLLEHYLDEQDQLESTIEDHKGQIKKTKATLARVAATVSITRTEIKTRTVLEPRPPEPPRQQNMYDEPTELPGTAVFTPSNLRGPIGREAQASVDLDRGEAGTVAVDPTPRCSACDATALDGVTLGAFGKELLCTGGTGCSAQAATDADETDGDDDDQAPTTPRMPPPSAEPTLVADKFEVLYPPATNAWKLHQELSFLLPGGELPTREQVDQWHPQSGIFNAIAHWARVEAAHLESQQRAARGVPPIGGLTVPQRLPMPEKLVEAIAERTGKAPTKPTAKGRKPRKGKDAT